MEISSVLLVLAIIAFFHALMIMGCSWDLQNATTKALNEIRDLLAE